MLLGRRFLRLCTAAGLLSGRVLGRAAAASAAGLFLGGFALLGRLLRGFLSLGLLGGAQLLDTVAQLGDQCVGFVDLVAPRQIFRAVHLLAHGVVAVVELAQLLLRLADLILLGVDRNIRLCNGCQLNSLVLRSHRRFDGKILCMFQIFREIHNMNSFLALYL